MPLTALTPGSRIGDRVFEALREGILSGELAPGDRLRIREVSAQLGTSVMPVRDAISRLEEAGLVEAIPYRGAVVRTLSPDDMLHLYEVRRVLEVEAASRGAERADERVFAQLRDRLDDVMAEVSGGSLPGFLDADEHFIDVLYGAAANPVLSECIHGLWGRSRSFKLFGLRTAWDADPTAVLDYQDDLLRAVERGDANAAGTIIASSIDHAMAAIRGVLSEG